MMQFLLWVYSFIENNLINVFLDLKGQIKKKMQEINELKQVKENQGEVQQRAKERAETVLQKYQKVTTILQNVLRVCGFSMLACILILI